VQDHWGLIAHVDELSQVLLGFANVDDSLRVIAKHSKVSIDVHVHGRWLHAVVAERLNDQPTLCERLFDGQI
jgi:hypothetical protein